MDKNYFRYQNEQCPVCREKFSEQDDIVVCPVCGTPHHRDCYIKNGKCGNIQLHSTDYRWSPQSQTGEHEKAAVEDNDSQTNGNTPPFGAHDGQPFSAQAGQMPVYDPLSLFPKELDEGVSSEDAVKFTQISPFRYLERFFHQKSGKRTWNWAAFFFTPYWFFYRKMHKLGAIFMSVLFAANLAVSFIPASAQLNNAMFKIYSDYISGALSTEAYAAEFTNIISTNKTGLYILGAYVLFVAAVHIFAAVNANKWYYHHTIQKIREIKSEFSVSEQQNMYIFKRGGVSIGAAVLAYMSLQIIIMGLNMLLTLL